MAKFKVFASYITYLDATIEADTLDQALDLAREMDGGDFKDRGFGDWNIDEVIEENE